MVVKPVIDTVQMFFDGVYTNPGTITVSKGTEVQFDVSVAGEDGAWYESTNCLVWLLDKLSNKAVWQSRQFTLSQNQEWHGGGGFTVEKEMDLVFQTWYWDGSRWVFSDQSDVWKVRLKSSGSQPSGGHPVPKINRENTFFLINGKRAYPGVYTVKKGGTVLFNVQVNNGSNYGGTCYVWLIDQNGKAVWQKEFSLPAYLNAAWGGGFSFVADRDATLKFQTWYWDNGWKFCDEYGNWTIKTESYAYPVIDKTKSYLSINGRKLPNPPCKVKTGTGVLQQFFTVINKGDTGKCRFVAYDTMSRTVLGETVKTLPAGAEVTIQGRMNVNRSIGFKFLAYRWKDSEWELTDEMG